MRQQTLRPSAQVIPFPDRGRFAVGTASERHFARLEAESSRYAKVDFRNWYHDDAIAEETSERSH